MNRSDEIVNGVECTSLQLRSRSELIYPEKNTKHCYTLQFIWLAMQVTANTSPQCSSLPCGLPAELRRVQGCYPEIQSALQDWPHLPVRPPSPSLTTTSHDSHIPPNSESVSKQARHSWKQEMTFGGAGCGLRTFFPEERKINSLANFCANLIFPAKHTSIISSNKTKIL